MGKWMNAILLLIVSIVLTRWIPFNSFFRNVDTMVHEFGHALTTLVFSGTVLNIELNPDHSGLTRSLVKPGWEMALVAISGYITASLFAWLLFSLYARGKQKLGLMLISLIAALSLVLFVRNGFGVAWLLGFLIVNGVILLFGGKTVSKYYFLLVAFLSLEESVTGPLTVLLASFANPAEAGDASVLARMTVVDAKYWAGFFTLFSLWCAVRAFQAFGGRNRRRKAYRSETDAVYGTDHINR